jgi:hypothetical protein
MRASHLWLCLVLGAVFTTCGGRSEIRKLAWTILAMLSGGVTLARAVDDPKIGAQIAAGMKAGVAALVAPWP